MNETLSKLFYNYADIFVDANARPFLRVFPDAFGLRGSMLIVNQLSPVCDLCEWISEQDVDLGVSPELLRAHVPLFVNAAEGVNVACGRRHRSVAGSSAIFETSNTAALEPRPAVIRRMTAADLYWLEHIEEHDVVEQFKFNLAGAQDIESFGLFEHGALAAFMDIAKLWESYTVSNIFTVRAYRGHGLASALLGNVLHERHGARFFYAATPAANTASVNLALRCGFAPLGRMICHRFA